MDRNTIEREYELLGVSPDADEETVRRAYRELSKRHHPDQGGSRERFLRIREAYERITGESAPTDGREEPDPTFHPATEPGGELTPPAEGITVEGEHLTLTLVALAQDVDLATALADDSGSAPAGRTVAFLRAYNPGPRSVRWRGREATNFIGSDGFMYGGSNAVSRSDRLPGRWSVDPVELRPGRAVEAVVVARQLPEEVSVEGFVYSQPGPDGGTERYLFELKPAVREELDRLPVD